ncbi:MAG: oligosaccharide flippase family protein [Pseudonocardia sp.]|nr:oligosaccharide flippase family protein [Pseudonocardia sp.]
MLVPVIGLATAPILTHSLGVAGRGEAGAAMAPNLFIVGAATLGLPAALTYYLAKRPHLARVALGWATLFAVAFGAVTLGVVHLTSGYLAAGSPQLAQLMVLGAWLALPALVVGIFRGAAMGRQMWTEVALERVVNSMLRLVLLGVLALLGELDVMSAVLVMSIGPVIAGLVYVRAGSRVGPPDDEPLPPSPQRIVPQLLAFGSQVWLGSVATMLLARSSQLLVTPLSDVEQLGLLLVAITISDVPYIITQTLREFTFGVNSAQADVERLLAMSRITTLVALAGSSVIGATLPLWIDIVFGSGFADAIVPTWLLLASSCLTVPGMIAGAGLDSVGRPGLRSASLVLALVGNLIGLVLLVPPWGAVGAALAALAGTLLSTIFAVAVAARSLPAPTHRFVVPQASDLALVRSTVAALGRRLRPTGSTR